MGVPAAGGEAVEHLDVLVVGAGLSGIGAAYRLATELPGLSWAVLEARDRLGGTWDLFRYPGVRSDSDMFTLGFPFRPWRSARSIVDGPSILSYLEDTAQQHGIAGRIRFGQRVTWAGWNSSEARWEVHTNGGPSAGGGVLTCGFLYMCSGYYDYGQGHRPPFAGEEDFTGTVVHPQDWPEDLDHSGMRVVVIGSGATAMTLVPALAERAAHVTMVQRSPTWVMSLPTVDPVASFLIARLPASLADRVVRLKNVASSQAFYQFCRRFPTAARRILSGAVRSQLPSGYPLEPDFFPSYDPWDQRLCVIADGDLFRALGEGRATVVTGTIERFCAEGVVLDSGDTVPADLIVTATGLRLQMFGGAGLSVDGRPVDPGDCVMYRGCMLSGVPNLAVCIGYTNASWTLRADLSSRFVCRLLSYMHRQRWDAAVAAYDGARTDRPVLDLSAGYVRRAGSQLPRQGTRAPWVARHNYPLDLLSARTARFPGGLAFSRRPHTRRAAADSAADQTVMTESSPP